MPDYYAILGVPRDASSDAIKRAYRKLARESHPDANPDDPHAEERFKAVSEAYDVLSDPEKRRRYDTFGDAGGPAFGGPGFGDLSDIVEAFFGGSPFGRTRSRRRGIAVHGENVGVAMEVTLEEAVSGVRREIEVPTRDRCARCDGDGCEPGTFRGRCSRCGGQGQIRSARNTILGTVMAAHTCTTCEGSGEAPAVPCTECRGAGRIDAVRTVTVDVPRGVGEGTRLRIRGQGEAGVRGGSDGDLYVLIAVEPHTVFERQGDDLVCALEVPLTQAVLGATIPVSTIDGEETIEIPSGMQHGAVVRLRGRGVPNIDGRGRGDLLIRVSVRIPAKLKPEERELFERLADLRGESHAKKDDRGVFRRLRDLFSE